MDGDGVRHVVDGEATESSHGNPMVRTIDHREGEIEKSGKKPE